MAKHRWKSTQLNVISIYSDSKAIATMLKGNTMNTIDTVNVPTQQS